MAWTVAAIAVSGLTRRWSEQGIESDAHAEIGFRRDDDLGAVRTVHRAFERAAARAVESLRDAGKEASRLRRAGVYPRGP